MRFTTRIYERAFPTTGHLVERKVKNGGVVQVDGSKTSFLLVGDGAPRQITGPDWYGDGADVDVMTLSNGIYAIHLPDYGGDYAAFEVCGHEIRGIGLKDSRIKDFFNFNAGQYGCGIHCYLEG